MRWLNVDLIAAQVSSGIIQENRVSISLAVPLSDLARVARAHVSRIFGDGWIDPDHGSGVCSCTDFAIELSPWQMRQKHGPPAWFSP